MRVREWKYEEGAFTYGQRIAVGDALADETKTWYERMKQAWRELYGWNARLMPPRMRARRFERMIDGLKYWIDVEAKTLHYEPTQEEKSAGIVRLNQEVGHIGTIKALAEKFACDPDTILTWQWAKIYGILHADLKEYQYHKRLSDNAQKRR